MRFWRRELLTIWSDDHLFGSSSADVLFGDNDDDQLEGKGRPDTLEGGAGDDVLIGGRGRDHLTGGDGADHFYIGTNEAYGRRHADRIVDFNIDSQISNHNQHIHDHSIHQSSGAKSIEADFSERDKLVLPASVAASSDHLHLHIANSIEEMQAFWNSGNVSVIYFKPEGKVYLSDNLPTFNADDFDSKGLLAKLNGSPEVFWEDFVFTS